MTYEFGEGLEGVLQNRKSVFMEYSAALAMNFNPARCLSFVSYDENDLSGKARNKRSSSRTWTPVKNVPIISVIHRLASQKGLNLVIDTFEETMDGAQFVLLEWAILFRRNILGHEEIS